MEYKITEEKFAIIMAGVSAVYPTFQIAKDKKSVEIWYRMLGDLTVEQLQEAVRKHIYSSTFPPTIADLRRYVAKDMAGAKAWTESWELAMATIRKYGTYNSLEAMEELEKVDKRTAETVKRLGYRYLCLSENAMADRANFRNTYESIVDIEVQELMLPESMRNQTKLIGTSEEMLNDIKNNLMIEKAGK